MYGFDPTCSRQGPMARNLRAVISLGLPWKQNSPDEYIFLNYQEITP
jgi:hypothetical protein